MDFYTLRDTFIFNDFFLLEINNFNNLKIENDGIQKNRTKNYRQNFITKNSLPRILIASIFSTSKTI